MNVKKERMEMEIAALNAQIAALSERKRKALIQLSATNSPGNEMSPEARREALAEVIAEGVVYLGERGLLPLSVSSTSSQAEKLPPPENCTRGKIHKHKKKN